MKKILIIKMSALGDVFMALPHVDAILSHHSEDEIWILTSPRFKDLFINHPRLRVAVLDRSKRFGGDSTWRKMFWVRRNKFAAIYDLQGNRTSRLLVRFSASPRRVGNQPKSIYNHHPEFNYTKKTQQNIFERLNQTLSSAGLPKADTNSVLYPSAADVELVAEWKKANDLTDGNYALMHAGSSIDWPSKRWGRDNYLDLARKLEGTGIKCVWVGGPDDRTINAKLAGSVGIDATDEFSVLQLYLLSKEAKFAVSNDSGPMHILAVAGIPVYSFFGPTSWIRSHAVGQEGRVFRTEIGCSPCFQGVCPPDRGHVCMDRIAYEEVFAKIAREQFVADRINR